MHYCLFMYQSIIFLFILFIKARLASTMSINLFLHVTALHDIILSINQVRVLIFLISNNWMTIKALQRYYYPMLLFHYVFWLILLFLFSWCLLYMYYMPYLNYVMFQDINAIKNRIIKHVQNLLAFNISYPICVAII